MAETDSIVITPLAERPSLLSHIYEIAETWPAFVPHDPVAEALLSRVAEDFPQYCVVATDGGRAVARRRACRSTPTSTAVLEITVHTAYLGRGLSYGMLAALRDAVGRQGRNVLLAPVRPTVKHLEPRVTMTDYVRRQNDDGFPAGPWLRVHVEAGGRIQRVASASMTVSGSLAQWRQWTGLPFDSDRDIDVPGAGEASHKLGG
ncbi:N-acetyltransferase [Streptomyces sp. NPDC052109]|uniref:N-acetyltransferase n=1 Tax=Streptomyces sp. NPDC052109 TaxID=3155527 RepID=UPI00342DECCE